MDEIKADRTGISDTTMGLNPKDLQSTAQEGVAAAVGASQMQIEMIARIFAKGGMSRMFEGILKLVKTHQDKVRTVRLRNEWVPIDPRFWNAGMDATVNTALGPGTQAERIRTLMFISEKQAEILQTLGPTNPLVTLAEYRNTLAEIVELGGYPNADRFFVPVSHQEIMQGMAQEKDQMTQELQQTQQENQMLQFELRKHTDAEDQDKLAGAFKDRASGVKSLVDAAATASENDVAPDAAADEIIATTPYLQ
jgi:hypothetical protein